MTQTCGCCTGTVPATPLSITNRPGLSALVYRIGTYASFFETMKARLSSPDFPALRALLTRESNDPSIALLDAWAILADVLTFYQERIADEGYLGTASERRSVIEIARVVGYDLRPGVSASAYVAYTVDPSSDSTIPAGSKVQSMPLQDQLPQTFETTEDLPSSGSWNNLAPRLTRPQLLSSDTNDLYIAGLTANLKANDPLLVVASPQTLQRIATVEVQTPQNRTHVTFQNSVQSPAAAALQTHAAAPARGTLDNVVSLVQQLSKSSVGPPANTQHLDRNVAQTFTVQADIAPAVLKTLYPEAAPQLYVGLKNSVAAPPVEGEVHAFRVQAAPFGNNAPLKPIKDNNGVVIGTEEWPLVDAVTIGIVISVATESDVERGGSLLKQLERSVARSSPMATITITRGQDSASGSVPISKISKPAQIGNWAVGATLNSGTGELTFDFGDFNHVYRIGFDANSGTDSVSVDSEVPIQIPQNQDVNAAPPGHRMAISTKGGLSITDVTTVPLDPSQYNVLALDAVYDQIVPESWVAISRPDRSDWKQPLTTQVNDVQKISIARYGMSARVTQLTLKKPWLSKADVLLTAVRSTAVSAQSEQLTLAEEPIADPINGKEIELGDLYGELPSGRWLVVEGERTDISGTTGITGAELAMLAGVEQKVQSIAVTSPAPSAATAGNSAQGVANAPRPGEQTHSFLQLSGGLANSYKRDTVKVYGNVVRSTHGETRNEVLGSGDGSKTMQQFKLHQPGVTHLPAATPKGVQSTLQVRVNDILWNEVDTLANASPTARSFATQTDDNDIVTITFGSRLPTGNLNVRATYRAGIGSAGNVAAQAISQLGSRPLGVKAVISPLAATGGVGREDRDQGKQNAPIAVAALDRLVSVQDYVDFARTYAGVGKASALQLSNGQRSIVHVTIAGNDPASFDGNSGTYPSLLQAFQQLGDPNLAIQLDKSELMLLLISAKVAVFPGYQLEGVFPQIRATLLDTYGFAKRNLAQSIPLSEVIAAIQSVPGVAYVDVTTLDAISQSDASTPDALRAKLAAITNASGPKQLVVVSPARFDAASGTARPAQLAFLSAEVPDTLILTEAIQ
jgi:predicted phage baseplate assembly protein